jgi:hypothetical protein
LAWSEVARTYRYTQVEVGRARYKDSISRRASSSKKCSQIFEY